MCCPLLDQRGPMIKVLGWRHVSPVTKNRGMSRRQRFRHERQFDERPHSYRKEKVDNLIGVEEGIKELFFFAYERSHFVGKHRVKTDVLKAQFVVAKQHLRLPVRPQRERRMSAPNGVLPKMRECFGGLRKAAYKVGHFLSS